MQDKHVAATRRQALAGLGYDLGTASEWDVAQRARAAQSEYLASLIGGAIGKLGRSFAAARKRARDHRLLMEMSDRQLADIGLVRGNILAVVYGERRSLVAAFGQPLVRQIRQAAKSILAWRQRRAAYLELASLDDHVLRDIGVSRSELVFAIREGGNYQHRSANVNAPRNAA